MNWVDILILVVWGLTAFWGFRSGLLQMVIPLVVVLVGLAFASRIAGPVGDLFSPLTTNENVQTVAAFIAIFIALLFIAAWVSFLFRTALRIIPLFGLVNSLAGMALGLLIGFVILSGLLTGLQRFPVGGADEAIEGSPLGTFMADNFDVVIRGIKLIPSDWDNRVEDIREGLGDQVPDALPDSIPGLTPDNNGQGN